MLRLIKLLILFTFLAIIYTGCDTVDSSSPNLNSGDWLLKESEIFDGGPGKDGIPALESPNFTSVGNIGYLTDQDLVLVVSVNDEIRIYPHPILDWHEIINDGIGETKYAITYCPLTGSGISWNRVIDGAETTFGVSGLLYNTNLIPYDRKTESNWSQMRLQSVNGSLISTFVNTFPLLEISWETAKTLFPEAKVVSSNTGFSRNYGTYPYGSYKTNHSSLLFPVNHKDSRVNSKERVLGLFSGDETKAYRILDFQNADIVVESIGSKKFLIYGDLAKNIITAFDISNFAEDTEFTKASLQLPYIVQDNLGNHYDIFGHSKEIDKSDLVPAKSFIAFWFAWAAFYPNTDLYVK